MMALLKWILSVERFSSAGLGAARVVGLIAVALAVGGMAGCGEGESDEYSEVFEDATDPSPSVRVVSLAPALTQMIVDMGLGHNVIGVGEHDAAAPEGARVVGHYLDVNSEVLSDLRPTHVLMMTDVSGVPAVLTQLASTQGFRLVTYPSPTRVPQVSKIIYDHEEFLPGVEGVPGNCLGSVLNSSVAARALTMRMHVQLAQISEVVSDLPRPEVLMVIETNPVMAAGAGMIHDQLLRYAGGQNAAAVTGMAAPTFDREKLVELDPEVILLLLPGGAPLGPINQDPRLAELRGLPIRAVRERRVALINDPLVQLPSSSMARVAAAMAKHVHPELSIRIDAAMATSLLSREEMMGADDPVE